MLIRAQPSPHAVTAPPVLYKYLRAERTDVVQAQKLRFTQPTATNDLFELKPVFDSIVPDSQFESYMRPSDLMLEEAMRRHYETLSPKDKARLSFPDLMRLIKSRPDVIDKLLNDLMPTFKSFVKDFTPRLREMMTRTFDRMIGILSLSEIPTNQLMWAHYASDHRGFVLGFDTANSFFDGRRSANDDFYHLRQVSYLDRNNDSVTLIEMGGKDIFFTKSTAWSYEREWRMIAPLGSDIHHPPADDEVVLFDFPASALHELVFGARATSAMRSDLITIVKSNPQLAHVRLREACAADRQDNIEIKDFHA